MAYEKKFKELVELLEKLRAPGGCAWDRKQTLTTAFDDLQDEVNELKEAIDKNDRVNISEELADVFWTLMFMMILAKEKGYLDYETSFSELIDKIVRRHDHVFGKNKTSDLKEIKANWEKIKETEKNSK